MNSKIKILFVGIALSTLPYPSFAVDYAEEVILVFREHRVLNNKFLATIGVGDLDDHKLKRKIVEDHGKNEYTDILHTLEKQFCETPHPDVLAEFMETLVNTSNSADEYPSFVLGALFSCEPELFTNGIAVFDADDQSTIIEKLEWGFLNITYKKESKFPSYDDLVGKLKTLKGTGSHN